MTSVARTTSLPVASRAPRPSRHMLALEEVRLRGPQRALVLIVAALSLAGAGWASVATLPETAIAPGEIVTEVGAAPVQHLEGGIVDAVLVAEGDLVTAGQPMLRMSRSAAASELGQLKVREAALAGQADLLEAFAANRPLLVLAATEPERAALAARLDALAGRIAIATEQLAQRRVEANSLEAQIIASDAEVAILRDERETLETLAASGLTTRMALLELRRMTLLAETAGARLRGELEATRAAEAEAEARIVEIRTSALDEARREAARVASERAELRETMIRLRDRLERTVVRAPTDGIVRGLVAPRPGGVASPGAVVAEVLPRDARLVIDARVSPRDIGFVTEGQPVNIKVQAFDFARYGVLPGLVERISAGAFIDDQGQPYHRVRIGISRNHVGQDPSFAEVAPGMTVQADIVTGEKTVLQYLLKPLFAYGEEALHER